MFAASTTRVEHSCNCPFRSLQKIFFLYCCCNFLSRLWSRIEADLTDIIILETINLRILRQLMRIVEQLEFMEATAARPVVNGIRLSGCTTGYRCYCVVMNILDGAVVYCINCVPKAKQGKR